MRILFSTAPGSISHALTKALSIQHLTLDRVNDDDPPFYVTESNPARLNEFLNLLCACSRVRTIRVNHVSFPSSAWDIILAHRLERLTMDGVPETAAPAGITAYGNTDTLVLFRFDAELLEVVYLAIIYGNPSLTRVGYH